MKKILKKTISKIGLLNLGILSIMTNNAFASSTKNVIDTTLYRDEPTRYFPSAEEVFWTNAWLVSWIVSAIIFIMSVLVILVIKIQAKKNPDKKTNNIKWIKIVAITFLIVHIILFVARTLAVFVIK